jgi:hypothetical protein
MVDLLERVLSVTTLRSVVRQRCCAGVSGLTISRLIASCVPAEVAAGFETGARPGRFPVELVPSHRRVAFLEALQRVPVSRIAVANEIATLRP